MGEYINMISREQARTFVADDRLNHVDPADEAAEGPFNNAGDPFDEDQGKKVTKPTSQKFYLYAVSVDNESMFSNSGGWEGEI